MGSRRSRPARSTSVRPTSRLPSEELAASGLAQFPSSSAASSRSSTSPASKPGQVRLSGPVLADIYPGNISKWNDAANRRAQSGPQFPAKRSTPSTAPMDPGPPSISRITCPGQPELEVEVRRRHDGALAAGIGGKGNEGVAGYVKQIPYSIGYVEYAYVIAEQDGLHLDAECGGQGSSRQALRASRQPLRPPIGRTPGTSTW